MINTNSPLNESSLGLVSRQVATAIFAAFPQFQTYAQTVQSKEKDGLSLVITVPSPTHEQSREIVIWVDEVNTPSIGFGPSHTHESADDNGIKAIVDTTHAIMSDKLVIIEDVGGEFSGHANWIDLREPQALEDELTGKFSPGRVLLKSWSGKSDREVGLSDLTL